LGGIYRGPSHYKCPLQGVSFIKAKAAGDRVERTQQDREEERKSTLKGRRGPPRKLGEDPSTLMENQLPVTAEKRVQAVIRWEGGEPRVLAARKQDTEGEGGAKKVGAGDAHQRRERIAASKEISGPGEKPKGKRRK